MVQRRHLSKEIFKFPGQISFIKPFVLCSFIFNITACSPDSDSGIAPDYSYSKLVESSVYTATPEFYYNYELLRYFYINQDKELGKPEDYIGKVDAVEPMEQMIPWDYFNIYYMYSQMSDPYTRYIDPSRSISYLNTLVNSKKKLDAGFELDSSYIPAGKYIINDVVKKSPADIAGLKKGDEITAIENIPITSNILYQRLSVADSGNVINFTVKRDSATLNFPVTVAQYNSPTVHLQIKDSIPIIKIKKFTAQTSNDSGTYGEFVEYLRQTEKYPTTILDLRNNGGGDVDQCIAMTKALLAKGDTAIIMTNTRADTIQKKQVIDTVFYTATVDGIAKDRYFVILSNGNTASCSEFMIAGITSNKKSPVIGTTTYGKGIAQTSKLTPSLSLAIITNIRVLDKNRVSFHKYGIVPDFVTSDDEYALAKAEELAKGMNYVRVAGYGTVNTGHFAKRSTEQDTILGSYFLPEEYRKKF